ncbi:hypothetical protein [uncultured Tissierella sp.]|uniref:hypothetical protein n=1 Tax=uncultured Tissierella sp. TaxID=448160 RepID=UPI002804ADFC|nr:hypothetical protein [uncultured Tissierella sp.]MDU5082837.1 hypothetical protein [Bacillota bacterium]
MNLVITLMILFLLLGFKIFNLLKGRINGLLLAFIFIISYSFIMNKLFELFEWRAIIFFFMPSIILWLVDFNRC